MNKHGGKRPGAGRPKGEAKTTLRLFIPTEKLEEIKSSFTKKEITAIFLQAIEKKLAKSK